MTRILRSSLQNIHERIRTYQTQLTSQRRCSQLQCPSQRRCIALPMKRKVRFPQNNYVVDQNLSKWGYKLLLSHPIRVDQPHRSRQLSDVDRSLRDICIRRLDRWLPLYQGGVVCQVAEGVQVQVARGTGTGKNNQTYIFWNKLVRELLNLNSAEVMAVT